MAASLAGRPGSLQPPMPPGVPGDTAGDEEETPSFPDAAWPRLCAPLTGRWGDLSAAPTPGAAVCGNAQRSASGELFLVLLVPSIRVTAAPGSASPTRKQHHRMRPPAPPGALATPSHRTCAKQVRISFHTTSWSSPRRFVKKTHAAHSSTDRPATMAATLSKAQRSGTGLSGSG